MSLNNKNMLSSYHKLLEMVSDLQEQLSGKNESDTEEVKEYRERQRTKFHSDVESESESESESENEKMTYQQLLEMVSDLQEQLSGKNWITEERGEFEAVEEFMLNTDDRDERLKAYYREGRVVDGKWVNNVD